MWSGFVIKKKLRKVSRSYLKKLLDNSGKGDVPYNKTYYIFREFRYWHFGTSLEFRESTQHSAIPNFMCPDEIKHWLAKCSTYYSPGSICGRAKVILEWFWFVSSIYVRSGLGKLSLTYILLISFPIWFKILVLKEYHF